MGYVLHDRRSEVWRVKRVLIMSVLKPVSGSL
jgi:hypothetical protein